MDATRVRIVGEVVLRLAAWLALAFAQIVVIGMSINALWPLEQAADPSPIIGRLWALALPVLFLANAATLLWRNPPEALAALGRLYLLIGGLIVTLLTGGLLFN
jgi:hypothetical protein